LDLKQRKNKMIKKLWKKFSKWFWKDFYK